MTREESPMHVVFDFFAPWFKIFGIVFATPVLQWREDEAGVRNELEAVAVALMIYGFLGYLIFCLANYQYRKYKLRRDVEA